MPRFLPFALALATCHLPLQGPAADAPADGEQLALNYNRARFGFVLDVPVTQLRYVRVGQPCRIRLPDGRTLPGRIAEVLATADAALQTQHFASKSLNGCRLS